MTLIADDEGIEAGTANDRRAPAREPRRSWASSSPYITRPVRPVVPPEKSWRRVSSGYARATVLSDLIISGGVTAALLWPYGRMAVAAGAVVGALFVLIVACLRGYVRRSLGVATTEFQSSMRAAFLLALVVMAFDFTAHITVPRRVVFLGLPLVVLITWVDRHARRRRLHRARQRGEAMQSTLVVGDLAQALRVIHHLDTSTHNGFAPVAACLPDPQRCAEISGVPVLGGFADIVQVVADRGIEVVVVASSALGGDALRRLSWALGRVKAEMVVAPDLVDVAGPRLALRPAAGLSLLEVEVEAPRGRMVAKSVMDRVLGAVVLLVFSPVIAAAAAAVAATSPGGPFFRQSRVGVDGRPFTMWKLRTMYRDAELRRDVLLESSDRDGPMFKMHEDPRITPIGKVLRRFSVDELPQLWNVVRGDMSLVGPRPPLLEEVAAYPDHVGRRLHVRPGLTGLWQVSGRADLDWDSSVTLDLRYVDNWSVTMDLMILWKTVRAVLKGSGAY